MTFRNRLFTIPLLLCHLLLSAALVTTQAQTPASLGGPLVPGEPITIEAQEQERVGDVFHLRGDVEIAFRTFTFRADSVTYNSATGDIEAKGNVRLEGGPNDETIRASRAQYNIKTETGRFHDVIGTTGIRPRLGTLALTTPEPFTFTGKYIDKVGPNKIVVHHGTATSCRLPDPKWLFQAQRLVVVPGEDAKIYHAAFRFFGVPIFYFPFADHPVQPRPRKSGFLLPNIGRSTQKGTILGEAFYWAINRSMDATLGVEYYSQRGWAQHGEFRALPSQHSNLRATFFGVNDRRQVPIRLPDGSTIYQDEGGQEVTLNGEGALPRGFRWVADIDYLSSYRFRLAFADTFTVATNSEVRSNAFIVNNVKGFGLGSRLRRYQNFQSATRGDVITIVHVPTFEVSSPDRHIGKLPFVYSFDASLEGLSRREPNFVTADAVGRLDLNPRIAMPLRWKGWSIRPEFSLRNTYYTDRLLPDSGAGSPVSSSINRRAVGFEAELRAPELSRIYQEPLMEHNFKHVIEPRVVYRRVEGIDNFRNILRFDERDILSNTHETEYSLTQRVYSKRIPKGSESCLDRAALTEQQQRECEGSQAREIVTWELAQKYFIDDTFGGALVTGRRNVLTTSAVFTGIAFLTQPRRFSPIISRLRVRTATNTDAEWHLDYDPVLKNVSSSIASLNYRFLTNYYVGAAHAFLRSPGEIFTTQPIATPATFNQVRATFQYGMTNRLGLNLGGMAAYDVQQRFLQYSAGQMTYNWDCCGMTVEYRRFALVRSAELGLVRNENQWRFALTLANVGTFGTLRKQERLF